MTIKPPSADTRTSDLKRLRTENLLVRERIKQGRLARLQLFESRRTQLMEAMSMNWLPAYADYLDRLTNRDMEFRGPTATWQRRRGQNWPIFQNETELRLLRAPSRILCTSNSYAIGLMEGLTSYVIGTGYTYRATAKNDAIAAQLPEGLLDSCQQVIDGFLKDNDWHGGEDIGLEEDLFQRSIEDGEACLVHYRQPNGTTQVRVVEPDQLTMPPGSDPFEYSFGVYTDRADVQKPLAYWVQFGDTPEDGEEFTPDEFTHLKRNVRRGIKRGIPDFSFDTGDAIRLAGILRENLTEGAAVQAAIVGVRQHETGTESEIQRFVDDAAEWTEPTYSTSGTGTVAARRSRVGFEDIPKGLGYVAGPGATNASAHIAVLESCLRGAGVRWNAPEWLSTGTGSSINYASSLTTESPFVRTVLRRQRNYRECFRRPVQFALEWAAESGLVRDAKGNVWHWDELKRVVEVSVEAPSPETRNLLEDAQRAAIEIPLGVDTRQQYAQRHDRDWDRMQADQRAWLEESGPQRQELPLPDQLQESVELLETRDEHGHEHDKDGKFASKGGGGGGGGGGKADEKPAKQTSKSDAIQQRLDSGEFGPDSNHLAGVRNEFDGTPDSAKSVAKAHADHFRDVASKLDEFDLSPSEKRSVQAGIKKANASMARATAKVEQGQAKIEALRSELAKVDAAHPPYEPPQLSDDAYPEHPGEWDESDEPDPETYDLDSPEGKAAYDSDLAEYEAAKEAHEAKIEEYEQQVEQIDADHQAKVDAYEAEYAKAVDKRERMMGKLSDRIEDVQSTIADDFDTAMSDIADEFDTAIYDAMVDHMNRLDEQK